MFSNRLLITILHFFIYLFLCLFFCIFLLQKYVGFRPPESGAAGGSSPAGSRGWRSWRSNSGTAAATGGQWTAGGRASGTGRGRSTAPCSRLPRKSVIILYIYIFFLIFNKYFFTSFSQKI